MHVYTKTIERKRIFSLHILVPHVMLFPIIALKSKVVLLLQVLVQVLYYRAWWT